MSIHLPGFPSVFSALFASFAIDHISHEQLKGLPTFTKDNPQHRKLLLSVRLNFVYRVKVKIVKFIQFSTSSHFQVINKKGIYDAQSSLSKYKKLHIYFTLTYFQLVIVLPQPR